MGVIKILSSKGWFRIEEYNDALRKHRFKSYESNDKPMTIKNPKANKLQGKAVSILTHMRCFGMVIEPLVKDIEDKVLYFAFQLLELTERLMASEYREFEIEILEQHVIDYLDSRQKIYDEFPALLGTPKPKHHYMCHYGEAIRKFGPPLCYWTGRYESKHRIAKGTVESSKNFVNITSTLAVRQQMRLASKYYSGFCDTSVVHMPETVTKKSDLNDDSDVGTELKRFLGENDVLCKEIIFHGQLYKIGDLTVLKANDRSTLEVGVIKAIVVKEGKVSFLSRKYIASRNHLNYFVTEARSDELNFCDPKHLSDFKPLIKYGTDMKFKFYVHHHISYDISDM